MRVDFERVDLERLNQLKLPFCSIEVELLTELHCMGMPKADHSQVF